MTRTLSVHYDLSQTANRAKFTLIPTASPPFTHVYTLSSQITVVLDQLCPDNHRRRVWRRPGHTYSTEVRRLNSGTVLQYPGLIFQLDNAEPHTACVAMNCFEACKPLPWPARSLDLPPFENAWDVLGRRLPLPGNFDDLT
ncbi:transposable element Tc1 transposase [Trichonephila clavipes]|nr:transposable element Tc1 transposase [Trichonephila clavipes]